MALPAFITTLQAALPGSVTHVSYYLGDWTIVVSGGADPRGRARTCATRRTPRSTSARTSRRPTGRRAPRDASTSIYCLYSTRHRHRVRVKAEGRRAPSRCRRSPAIWPAANWLEREVYDMFGVNFTGHPDRRRILMPDDWQGFPQRKDYPLEGPGELLMENPIDWLKLRQAREQADIE